MPKSKRTIGQVKSPLTGLVASAAPQPANRAQLSAQPSPDVSSSLTSPALTSPPKRGRGRPRKPKPEDKALKTLKHVVDDTLELGAATLDGGGTPDDSPVVTKESLERRIARRLNVLDRYLTDDRLHQLLQLSGLKEIGVYEGIMMDKALVLKGQPTVIVGSEDRQNLESVLPKLLNEMRRRKLITAVSERKVEFTDAS